MLRQPRLDAPGRPHHVMGRGIDRQGYSGSRKNKVSKAWRLFCQLAVRKMGYPGAQVPRFLGVTTSAVVRVANFEDLPEIENYL